jgi:hypothetical protein
MFKFLFGKMSIGNRQSANGNGQWAMGKQL